MTIQDLFVRRCDEPSDISEHVAYFAETCVELDAKKVIELGVRTGVSTAGWLYGLEQTDGHLWSVDPDDRAVGTLPSDRWTFIHGADLDETVIAQLPEQVDVVFIDTTHHYRQTINELAAYVPRVRPGGRVLLHDTELQWPDDHHPEDPPYPVKAAITTFCDVNGLAWSNRPFCYGLGCIQIPE